MALNPPYLFFWFLGGFFVSAFPLSFLCFNKKKTLFPLKKDMLCFFLRVSLCFSLGFFGLPLFHFLFLCLSLFLFFLPSFLSFLFALFWFLLFLSVFIFVSSLLLFHEKNNIKILNSKVFHINIFSFSFVSCLVFLSRPFS